MTPRPTTAALREIVEFLELVAGEPEYAETLRHAADALDATQELLRAIHTAVRGDQYSECRTIRKWLDARGQYHEDIGSRERLIEIACAELLVPAPSPAAARTEE